MALFWNYCKFEDKIKIECYNKKYMKGLLKRIYTKEYLLFLAIGFLPLIYKVFQIAFLNSFDNAIKILGQMALIEIIFKIFQETIINPLFKILGKNDNAEEVKNYFARKLLIVYSAICLAFALSIFFLVEPIMNLSQIPTEIFVSTKSFLQVMIFVNGINVIAQYLYTFNIISKNTKNIFVYFLISSLATLILGIILIPKFAFGLGVIGLAISILVVKVAQLVYFLFTMPKVSNNKHEHFDGKRYLKLCLLSFFETLTRNLTYYFVVLVLLNTLNNQDLYFIANDFIWSVMLIPTIAQNDLIKQNVSQNNNESLKGYLLNSVLISIFIGLMVPVAFILFKYVFKFSNYLDYFLTLLKLLPCYFVFIFDNVIESYFIAIGKMQYVFIQTFITNIIVYMTSYIFYLCGVWIVTLNGIILVFSAGMVLSSAYTIGCYLYEKKKIKKATTLMCTHWGVYK